MNGMNCHDTILGSSLLCSTVISSDVMYTWLLSSLVLFFPTNLYLQSGLNILHIGLPYSLLFCFVS